METSRLISALKWREAAERGEMICKTALGGHDNSHYDEHHYAFAGKSISQKTLDLICEAANTWWKLNDSNLRIGNSMGELIPGHSSNMKVKSNDTD